MPTIFRIGAARVVIYLNDRQPAHVHVLDGKQHAIFNLATRVSEKPTDVWEVALFFRMTPTEHV